MNCIIKNHEIGCHYSFHQKIIRLHFILMLSGNFPEVKTNIKLSEIKAYFGIVIFEFVYRRSLKVHVLCVRVCMCLCVTKNVHMVVVEPLLSLYSSSCDCFFTFGYYSDLSILEASLYIEEMLLGELVFGTR